MTQDDDRLLQALTSLPPVEPDTEWEARVRAHCHSVISRHASRRARARRNRSTAGLIALAATALCVYLAAVLAEAARLAGLVYFAVQNRAR